MFGKFAGKKTYVVSVLAILGAVGAVLTGDMQYMDAGKIVLEAILAMTIRHGIAAK